MPIDHACVGVLCQALSQSEVWSVGMCAFARVIDPTFPNPDSFSKQEVEIWVLPPTQHQAPSQNLAKLLRKLTERRKAPDATTPSPRLERDTIAGSEDKPGLSEPAPELPAGPFSVQAFRPKNCASEHAVEFAFETHPIAHTAFAVSLWVSTPAQVELIVNDEPAGSRELAAGPAERYETKRVEWDISKWTHASRLTKVRLVIRQNAAGTFILPTANEPRAYNPQIAQGWHHTYSPGALLFYVAAWLSIQAILVVVAAHQPIPEWLRNVSFGATAVGWCGYLLRVPGLAQVPLQDWLRRLYGGRWRLRPVLLAGLLPFLSLGGKMELDIAKCLKVRHEYTSDVRNYLANPNADSAANALRNAINRVPERVEAQVLLSRRIWTERAGGPGARAKLVRNLVEDPRVGKRIEALAEKPLAANPYLDPDPLKSFQTDPVLWYVSILPDGDAIHETAFKDKAIALLRKRSGEAAQLLEAIFALDLAIGRLEKVTPATPEELASARKEGQKAADTVRSLVAQQKPEIYEQHWIQEGWDKVAQFEFVIRDNTVEGSLQESVASFRQVLTARGFQANESAVPFVRAPQKLVLFWLMGAYRGQTDATYDFVNKTYLADLEFKEQFEKKIWLPHVAYQKDEGWYAHTAFDPVWFDNVKKDKFPSLDQGWKF